MTDLLNLKIRQMHEALGRLENGDISSLQPIMGVVGNQFYWELDFSQGCTEANLHNIATLLIHNIACIKDHLKHGVPQINGHSREMISLTVIRTSQLFTTFGIFRSMPD
jgi:hypothetical protein